MVAYAHAYVLSAYKPVVSGHVTVAPAAVQPRSSTSYWDDTRDLDVTGDGSSSSSSATNDQVVVGGASINSALSW